METIECSYCSSPAILDTRLCWDCWVLAMENSSRDWLRYGAEFQDYIEREHLFGY